MLEDFLDNKPLYYDKIDYTRMPRVYETVKQHFQSPKVIHIIGTNGKGTTGRFLASALFSLNYHVGHYSSPHILNFNERIWMNGLDIDNKSLNEAHEELLKLLHPDDADALSYFEYTTLLAMWIYKDMDYVVLEAGLGGEHDATSVFPNILSLITPIGIDHEAFLGNTLQEIAKTKMCAVQKMAIISEQFEREVYEVADKVIGKQRYKKASDIIDKNDEEKIKVITKELSLAPYLQTNLKLAIATLKYLQIDYKSNNFFNAKLFGRLTPLNNNILIDVGHNVLASEAILDTLKGKKYILVYNSFKDKNYEEILKILKPIISHVEIIEIDDKRAEDKRKLEDAFKALDIEFSMFEKIALDEKYLVFGSFSVVESFLKVYNG